MAERVEKVIHFGGTESRLSILASVFLGLGIIGCLVGLVVGLTQESLWVAVVGGAGALLHGLLMWALLGASADAIRLLKKLNGLPYAGDVSPTTPVDSWACSACGARVQELQGHCGRCGKSLDAGA